MELIYEIISLNSKIKRDFESKISAVGLTYPKWIVLKTIKHNEGLKACDLKEKIGMDKATLSELLNRLEREECIIKKSDQNDRRISRLYLTEKTLCRCSEAMQIEEEYYHDLTSKISEEDIKNLTNIFSRLNS